MKALDNGVIEISDLQDSRVWIASYKLGYGKWVTNRELETLIESKSHQTKPLGVSPPMLNRSEQDNLGTVNGEDKTGDTLMGCGKSVWNDWIKKEEPCGTQIGIPDDYLLCEKCSQILNKPSISLEQDKKNKSISEEQDDI